MDVVSVNKNPGPGTYVEPSEFGHYVDKKFQKKELHMQNVSRDGSLSARSNLTPRRTIYDRESVKT